MAGRCSSRVAPAGFSPVGTAPIIGSRSGEGLCRPAGERGRIEADGEAGEDEVELGEVVAVLAVQAKVRVVVIDQEGRAGSAGRRSGAHVAEPADHHAGALLARQAGARPSRGRFLPQRRGVDGEARMPTSLA